MTPLLTIIGVLVVSMLLLVLLVLSIPWVISLTGDTAERRVSVDVRAIRAGSPIGFAVSPTERSREPSVARDASFPSMRRRDKPKKVRSRGRTRRMVRAMPDLMSGLLSTIRIERLAVSGRLGLDDPAETGQLFGILMPLRFMATGTRFAVDIEPDFDGPSFNGRFDARLRFQPVRAMPAAMRFGWRVFAGHS